MKILASIPRSDTACVTWWRGLRIAFAVVAFTFLAACGARVDLLAAVPETEANEVLSVLLDAGINAQKAVGKAGVSVSVEAEQVERALTVLRGKGLPRERFDGMGQIFRKEGLVSSPLEERARYIYALSQELANTLSQMDGVITARVHVVLPERGGVGEVATPSTAAVFIKNQPGYALDALLPQIRRLVIHAIPGLTDDRVSVTLVNAQPGVARAQGATQDATRILGIAVEPGSVGRLSALLAFLLVMVLTALLLGAWVAWQRLPKALRDKTVGAMRGKRATPASDDTPT